jgi:23S rRNA (adenine2030-N6)-methyltransferase
MNYRHAYHAGSHSDVLKHALLTATLERLLEKPAPLFLLDTHAGIGQYDLAGDEAGRTGEWRTGIGRLIEADAPALHTYLAMVRAVNPPGELLHYPGSPAIAAAMMRPGDRLVLSELHPEDADALRRWARRRPGIAVHQRDAYELLGAMLPPAGGRGLIVVDPPYEVTDEYERLASAIIAGHRRWPGGRWLVWYPVKDRTPVWRLEEALLAAGIPGMLAAELTVRPPDGVGLAGSGVLLINPPYGLDVWLAEALPQLQAALAPDRGGHVCRWLTPGA